MKYLITIAVVFFTLSLSAQKPTLNRVINSTVIDTVELNGTDHLVYSVEEGLNVLVVRSTRGVILYRVSDSDILFIHQYGSSWCEKLERI